MEVRETLGRLPGSRKWARAGSTAALCVGPGGRAVRGPGSPRTPGRSGPPRPAAQQPVPPARLATERSLGRRTPALAVPAGPTPLSAPLQPAPRVRSHAAEAGPRECAAQGASDSGLDRLLTRVGSDVTSFRTRANRLVLLVGKGQEVCSCRSG